MKSYCEGKLDSGEDFGIHNCEFKTKIRLTLDVICNKYYIIEILTFSANSAI